ncbi:hypothetical protein IMZ48_36390 [Candidatus Bathyarchaeota archaeon]|nr:hypothetical protein [Candidatus Bathyarchaeota archaeon]
MEDWNPPLEAITVFSEAIKIPDTEVIYLAEYVTIVLGTRDADTTKLTGRAGGIAIMYRYEDEMGRPELFQARRATDTTPGNPDNSMHWASRYYCEWRCRLQPVGRVAPAFLPQDVGCLDTSNKT